MAEEKKTKEERKTSTEKNAAADTAADQQSEERTEGTDLRKKTSWNGGQLFWGLLLILVGVMALLDNFGILDVDLGNVFRLWPLLLVAGGLSLLALRGWVARIATLLFIAVVLAAVFFVSIGGAADTDARNVETRMISIEPQDGVSQARIKYGGGAGTINLNGAVMDELVRGRLESDSAELNQVVRNEGDTQIVQLSLEGSNRWWFGEWRNDLDLDITQDLPVELTLETGAADVQGDVSGVQLRKLDIDTGASSVDLRLGDKVPLSEVTVNAGASSITLHVPASAGVRLRFDGGLSGTELAGLQDRGNGLHESDDYDEAEHKIDIRTKLGAANFELVRY